MGREDDGNVETEPFDLSLIRCSRVWIDMTYVEEAILVQGWYKIVTVNTPHRMISLDMFMIFIDYHRIARLQTKLLFVRRKNQPMLWSDGSLVCGFIIMMALTARAKQKRGSCSYSQASRSILPDHVGGSGGRGKAREDGLPG